MERLRYYTSKNEESTIFEVWVYSVVTSAKGTVDLASAPVRVATCEKQGDARFIQALLQKHEGANRDVA